MSKLDWLMYSLVFPLIYGGFVYLQLCEGRTDAAAAWALVFVCQQMAALCRMIIEA